MKIITWNTTAGVFMREGWGGKEITNDSKDERKNSRTYEFREGT